MNISAASVMSVKPAEVVSILKSETNLQEFALNKIKSDNAEEKNKIETKDDGSSISVEDAEEISESLWEHMNFLKIKLNFSVDDGTGRIIIKVIDKETDELLKQIPPESLLAIQEKMMDFRENSSGILVDETV